MLTVVHERELGGLALLRLEGSIVDEFVDLLELEVRSLVDAGYSVSLDCHDVVYLRRRGAAMLRRVERLGVGLLRCPPLIECVLRRSWPHLAAP